jgi:hypothetical protein
MGNESTINFGEINDFRGAQNVNSNSYNVTNIYQQPNQQTIVLANDLPRKIENFIGRQDELAEIEEIMAI